MSEIDVEAVYEAFKDGQYVTSREFEALAERLGVEEPANGRPPNVIPEV